MLYQWQMSKFTKDWNWPLKCQACGTWVKSGLTLSAYECLYSCYKCTTTYRIAIIFFEIYFCFCHFKCNSALQEAFQSSVSKMGEGPRGTISSNNHNMLKNDRIHCSTSLLSHLWMNVQSFIWGAAVHTVIPKLYLLRTFSVHRRSILLLSLNTAFLIKGHCQVRWHRER